MTYFTYRLTQISTSAIKAADVRYMNAVGLKVRELRVLRLLHAYPDCTAVELLQYLELDKTLLSRNLATLEQKGFIQRQADSKDARRQILRLTEAGTAAWLRAEQIGQDLERDMFGEMTAAQWTQLHDLLILAQQSLAHWQERQLES